MTTAIKLENVSLSDLENFNFYVEDREWGHVIANFTLANKQFSAFLQLPDTPDSAHKLHYGSDLQGDLLLESFFTSTVIGLAMEKLKQNFNCDDDYLSYLAVGVDIKRNAEIVCNCTCKEVEFWVVHGVNNSYYLVKQYEIGGYDMFTSKLIKKINAGNFAQACYVAKKYLDNEYDDEE